jgi:hypothetical protein
MFTPRTLSVGGLGVLLAVSPMVFLPTAFGSPVFAVLGISAAISLYIWYLNTIMETSLTQEEINKLSSVEEQEKIPDKYI